MKQDKEFNGLTSASTAEVRRFSSLTDSERRSVFEFVSRAGAEFRNLETMQQAMTGAWFEQGRHLLTLWAGRSVVTGTIGVITKDARARSEVFLTSLYVAEGQAPEALPQLLPAAYRVARSAVGVPPDATVWLGVHAGLDVLRPHLERAGFRPAYRALEMTLASPEPSGSTATQADGGDGTGGANGASRTVGAVRFEPVTMANVDGYVAVHNAAFLGSPNGATTDAREVSAELAAADFPDQYQLAYVDGLPAVSLALTVKDRVGNLDLLAVAPAFQGRGLGRAGLRRVLDTFLDHGVTDVRLQVIESNARAVSLYANSGFIISQTIGNWCSGPPLFDRGERRE